MPGNLKQTFYKKYEQIIIILQEKKVKKGVKDN